ncbi:transglycosylase domain-containing protein [Aeromicrobium sp.]|uniref:transglycosylase domain-containing protein n=1 Tax=Aeromicrobium sp. TaxID=1871063 RepID=UPI002FC7DD09
MAAQRKRVATKASSRAAGKPNKLRAFSWKISGRGPWYTAALRWFAFLGVVGTLIGAITFFVLYQAIKIPDPNAAFKTETTKVYYSDGKHRIGSFATQDRESIPLSDMPASMQAAVIAAEDRSFYTNRGIDVKGIIRAARNNATSGEIQGGASTITQQYVKILYLNQERSYTRKVKEAILSIKIHNQLTKKEILEGYLNTIYFGNGSYGLEVAAQTYFDKPAKELDFQESALLATIINSPSFYDPYVEGAESRITPRFHYVLDGMLKSGAITADQRAEWQDKLPKVAKLRENNRYKGTKGFLLSMVKKEMLDLEFSESQIDGQGLRIITTFDYNKQKDAVAAVKAVKPAGLKQLHTALVSIQPGTGAVRALYGGPDYLKSQLNWATLGTQPGSTFKIFSVIAALENGYSLKTELNGASPVDFGNGVVIENQGDSGGRGYGKIPLLKATENSVNTAFADLVDQMDDGPGKTLDAANEAGIPTSVTDKFDRNVLSVPLGYAPVPPIDMANAYATIAASGKKADWYVIKKVTDFRKKETLHEHKKETEQSIPKDVAADTIAALQQVVRSGSGTNGRTICPTGGKTGTATAGEGPTSRVSSSWFAGITPKLATAVMYNRGKGNEELEGYMNPFFGGTYPAITFRTFMNAALDPANCGTFPPPANIKSTKGTNYKKPPPNCKGPTILNPAKTKCVLPPPPDCDPPQVLNDAKTACVDPAPVDQCPTEPGNGPCADPEEPATEEECIAAGGNWNDFLNKCSGWSGGEWKLIPLIVAGYLYRRRMEELEPILVRDRS